MKNSGLFGVFVAGSDITLKILDICQSIRVSDKAGTGTDTATIVLDDSSRSLVFPRHNAKISILMGHTASGLSIVFNGNVDEVRSEGSRNGGSTIVIEAKGFDTSGKAKEPQNRHFDDKTIEEILTEAASFAGITDVRVDAELGAIVRKYEHMDDESFIAFGERLSKEIGGTFKIRNDIAVMAKKNGTRTPSGAVLPPVLVARGENLHAWSIAPYIGRKRYREIRVKYYDKAKAKHEFVTVETGIEGSDAISVGRFQAPNKEQAEEKAQSLKEESERSSGVGFLVIEGNPGAQPEAVCILVGSRFEIDGSYIIEGVDHEYNRGSGYVTSLSLAHRV